MIGQYSEKLESGGELVVSVKNWHIKYYFSGPDLRYNGTFITLKGEDIDQYIQAWNNNFQKYLELKKTIPSGGEFTTPGEMGMSIRIGWAEGVCIKSYHMPIKTLDKLSQVIRDYHYAKERANSLQQLLQTL